MLLHQFIKILLIFCVFAGFIKAQDTNPVERQVSNPLTDTPNINPVAQEQTVKTSKPLPNSGRKPEGGDDELYVDSTTELIEGVEGARVFVRTGAVDARYGIYRLQADKITIYEADGRMVAEGSVVFDQGEDQRITGTRGEFNYRTKLGFFIDSTGFTNQTNDGTVI
nr:hypothetical protein [Acidobacteriota bacterium]